MLYVRFRTLDNYDFHYYQDDLNSTIGRYENIMPTDEFICYTKYKIPIIYKYNYNEGNNTYIQKYYGNQCHLTYRGSDLRHIQYCDLN